MIFSPRKATGSPCRNRTFSIVTLASRQADRIARRIANATVAALLALCSAALAPDVLSAQGAEPADELFGRLDSLYRAGELREGVALADSVLAVPDMSQQDGGEDFLRAVRMRLLVARGKLAATDAFVSHESLEGALRTLRRAVALADSVSNDTLRADALVELGFAEYVDAFLAGGAFGPIRSRFEESLRLAREASDPERTARSLFHIGLIHERLGEQQTASDRFQESLALADACGCLLVASYAQRHLGFARIRAGDLPFALLQLQRSLELRERVGFRVYLPYSLAVVADVLREKGEPNRAAPYARRAVEIATELEAPRTRVAAELALAEVLLATGQTAEARERFHRALETSQSIGYESGSQRARAGLERIEGG